MTKKLLHSSIHLAATASFALLLGAFAGSTAEEQAAAPQLPPVKSEQMDRWMKELSNWGRWGKTDQMGTVNLITPAKRRSAAALVKEGYSVSLSRVADTVKTNTSSRLRSKAAKFITYMYQ